MSVGSATPCAELYNNNGPLLFQFRTTSPYGMTVNSTIASMLPTNSWHHIVSQWAAPNNFNIYIDGTNMAITTNGSLGVFTNSSYHFVGKMGRTAGQMRGLIDDARVYTNLFLSFSDVTNLRAQTFKPNSDIENGGTKWP
jgi:hypothetical protein